MYLVLQREEGRKKERERNINVWLLLTCFPLGTLPSTQACALTGNRTSDPLVHRLPFSPLSHTSQGFSVSFISHHSFPCTLCVSNLQGFKSLPFPTVLYRFYELLSIHLQNFKYSASFMLMVSFLHFLDFRLQVQSPSKYFS